MLKRHKYDWSRATLEVFYKSYIRSIIEYGNIIYDSCTQADSIRLENVQLEAARIATGGKRCTSHSALYNELGWQTLETRRKINKLIKMYNVVNKKAPKYLSNIFQVHQSMSKYETRHQSSLKFSLPKCNTTMYQNSVIMSCMYEWNKLSSDLQKLPSISLFKKHIHDIYSSQPLLFNHDTERNIQIAFAQIRMGFSNLNFDLYSKGCVESKDCECGNVKEDARHFFLKCPNYNQIRIQLYDSIRQINPNISVTLPLLLKGSKHLSLEENMCLFKKVYCFIQQSNRF